MVAKISQDLSVAQRLPNSIASRLRLPLIAAPMLHVSGPKLVLAACQAGVIGAFPTANARSTAELNRWLQDFSRRNNEYCQRTGIVPAPICPNLILRHARLDDDIACLVKHRVEMVITSVGAPGKVIPRFHDINCLVFADVATLRHVRSAITAGVDGLVLLSGGAGGQTGWMNPLAFVRAVRPIFEGPIVLAGGISDGVAMRAAEVLGCDLVYMGTKFIATHESLAENAYRTMLVQSSLDDVMVTRAFTGLQTSMLRPSILAAGLDPERLDEQVSVPSAANLWGAKADGTGPKRWTGIWSAGHSVSGVLEVSTVKELVAKTQSEYQASM